MLQHLKTLDNTARARYYSAWGLAAIDIVPLTLLSPALNLLLSRPTDPTHLEYQGMSRLMHQLLITNILHVDTAQEYYQQLRSFPFPPGYGRLQSPIHHLKSYKMHKHARWSIVCAPLLRYWLKTKHLRPLFAEALRRKLNTEATTIAATEGEAAYEVTEVDMIMSIIQCFSALAKSNSVIMARRIIEKDREQLLVILVNCRSMFQSLIECAATVADLSSHSRVGSFPTRRSASRATSEAPGTKEAHQYSSNAGQALGRQEALPTIHTALHFIDIVDEYGLALFINTLIWEDFHRGFKNDVYTTNHANIERLLLEKANFRITIRLLLLGAFNDTDAPLTELIQDIQRTYPSLFESLLPRSKVAAFNTQIEDKDDDNQQTVQGDDQHQRPRVISRISPQHIKSQLNLPNRASNALSDDWRTALREGYAVYGKGLVRDFKTQPMMWCKKVSYYNPSVIPHSPVYQTTNSLSI